MSILKAAMFIVLIIPPKGSYAQVSSSATQLIRVESEPTIQITAISSPNVHLSFDNMDHYAKGQESGSQQFKVHSNRDFVINVRTDAASFSYSGSAYPVPQMPVKNILYLSVSDNNTGGNIANTFRSYSSLSNSPKDLLLNCSNGGDKTFSINYKASPGTEFPAGDYTVGVIYTATQP